jgi:2-polyprenyl-3-methyl-5-hydroxy-6-metoxy-1,4-benzoquinol methylase
VADKYPIQTNLFSKICSWIAGLCNTRRASPEAMRSPHVFTETPAPVGIEVGPIQPVGRVIVPDELMGLGMKYPAEASRLLREMAQKQLGPDVDFINDVALVYPVEPFEIPHKLFWRTSAEKIIWQTSADLVDLLDTFVAADVGKKNVFLDKKYFTSYLYMNTVRVLNMYDAMLRKGFRKGALLELGSYFGSFALAFQRLGYEVTAVDRYRGYGRAFDAYVELMTREGVRVVSTDRADEKALIDLLPRSFDCVLSAAVIEHIPHTPREFLGLLTDRCRLGGLVCLDTPNLSRWWNRQRLNCGETIFQDITQQFYCEIPYEGHHREYTGSEMVWMMQQIGCTDVETTYFDYNMFQFQIIDRPHITCLLSFMRDPALADTILVCGRLENRRLLAPEDP